MGGSFSAPAVSGRKKTSSKSVHSFTSESLSINDPADSTPKAATVVQGTVMYSNFLPLSPFTSTLITRLEVKIRRSLRRLKMFQKYKKGSLYKSEEAQK